MATVFYFSYLPDLNTEDEYHMNDTKTTGVKRSIWSHKHFSGAVLSQFLYVAAQAGILVSSLITQVDRLR